MNATIDHLFPSLDSRAIAGIHAASASSLLACLRQWELRNVSLTVAAALGAQHACAALDVRLWQLAQAGANGYILSGMERNEGKTAGLTGGITAAFRKRENSRLAWIRLAAASSFLSPVDEFVRPASLGILERLSRLLA